VPLPRPSTRATGISVRLRSGCQASCGPTRRRTQKFTRPGTQGVFALSFRLAQIASCFRKGPSPKIGFDFAVLIDLFPYQLLALSGGVSRSPGSDPRDISPAIAPWVAKWTILLFASEPSSESCLTFVSVAAEPRYKCVWDRRRDCAPFARTEGDGPVLTAQRCRCRLPSRAAANAWTLYFRVQASSRRGTRQRCPGCGMRSSCGRPRGGPSAS
jgi:hypothetical protein